MEWDALKDDVKSVWVENAAFWDERVGEEGNRFHRELVLPATERLLEGRAGWRVLEIACGNGSFARRMAAHGMEVVATDVSDAFIERAKSRTTADAGRVTFQVLDATDRGALLALGERSFDAAVANMALMDIPAIDPLFEALSRLLKPGGRFVFTVMHPCYNGAGITKVAEETDADGVWKIQHSIKVGQYLTPVTFMGLGMIGQPRPQHYFHRPLHVLFGHGFRHGFALTGLEEPAFASVEGVKDHLSWEYFHEFPPVLAVRMTLSQSASQHFS